MAPFGWLQVIDARSGRAHWRDAAMSSAVGDGACAPTPAKRRLQQRPGDALVKAREDERNRRRRERTSQRRDQHSGRTATGSAANSSASEREEEEEDEEEEEQEEEEREEREEEGKNNGKENGCAARIVMLARRRDSRPGLELRAHGDDEAADEPSEACEQLGIKLNSQVNAKIGHFERLSLADQRLLLLSAAHANWQQEEEEEEEEEQQQQTELAAVGVEQFGGRAAAEMCAELQEDEAELHQLEDYLGLDTIVEEDEESCEHLLRQQQQSNCDSRSARPTTLGRDACERDGNAATASQLGGGGGASLSRPQKALLANDEHFCPSSSASSSLESSSMATTTTATTNNSNSTRTEEEEWQQTKSLGAESRASMHSNGQQVGPSRQAASGQDGSSGSRRRKLEQQASLVLLPSTNRLISEHQARQQQATLFRVLSERQRMLDQLGPLERLEQADLLVSGHKLAASGAKQQQAAATSSGAPKPTAIEARRRRRRKRSATAGDSSSAGLPLSALDLSSMSDRMLDNLLGHIASASSGQSASCSSADSASSDSSQELAEGQANCGGHSSGCSSDEEAQGSSWPHARNRRWLAQAQAHAQPRPPTGSSKAPLDHDSLEHLARLAPSVIGVHEDEQQAGEWPTGGGGRLDRCREAHRRARGPSRGQDDDDEHERGEQAAELRRTLVGELDEAAACTPAPPAASSSVEAVLGRMLAALGEASAKRASPALSVEGEAEEEAEEDEEEQRERLNELLERGFLHLEQLLNCNLAPNNAHQQQQQQQVAPLAQPTLGLKQTAAATLASSQKDSDYGSDTQSAADCLSAVLDQQQQQQQAERAPGASSLSPLAVELSLKLAESLHALAQRQQRLGRPASLLQSEQTCAGLAQQASSSLQVEPSGGQPLAAAPRRTPMRSIVMIGSPTSERCPSGAGNVSPARFRTLVSIGATGGQQQQQQLVSVSSCSSPQLQASSDERRQQVSSEELPESDEAKELREEEEEEEEEDRLRRQELQVVQVSSGQSALGRSSRSSLRRGPSLRREPGAPRPNSPRPAPLGEPEQPSREFERTRSLRSRAAGQVLKQDNIVKQQRELADQEAQMGKRQQQQVESASAGASCSNQSEQRQLQRALELAQKYNYSPAKFAASKLGSKLGVLLPAEKSAPQQVGQGECLHSSRLGPMQRRCQWPISILGGSVCSRARRANQIEPSRPRLAQPTC